MTREIDRRDFTINRVTAAREKELKGVASEVSDRLPGAHRLRIEGFDAKTGNPSLVMSEAAPVAEGNFVQRALDHVMSIRRTLGLTETQPAEFVADPGVQRTSSGAATVHLQQHYKGIPIFGAAEAVRFGPDGALKETVGNSVTVAENKGVAYRLSAEEAVLKAAHHVAVPHNDELGAKDPFGEPMRLTSVDLSGFVPKVIAVFPDKAEQPTVLEAGPFGDRIRASLIWFPLDDDLRLCWETIITMPNQEGQFRTMVDSETGEILYCRQLMRSVKARGNVYRIDGESGRQMSNFPKPLDDHGVPIPGDLPSGFPDDWVETDSAEGNCVKAHLGSSGPTIRGTIRDGILTFDPSQAEGDDQKVLNIFYYNCVMHDYFYMLGFREEDGNFQVDNFGRGGSAGDSVDACAHSGSVYGTANMGTPIDGMSPTMNMGMVTGTGRHTAFDSSVVFHEFTHGVTNRLIGGPMNVRAMEDPQSAGMGEGFSDYFPCTINDTIVVGTWVVNDPSGIRMYPYDSHFPDHFGHVGTGRYVEEHDIGEIWCATLMEMNRQIGATFGVQVVMDALKLSPANPSFLDMRDAILRALEHRRDAGHLSVEEYSLAYERLWAVFAKFGMGVNARSNGASLSGIVADFTAPPDGDGELVRVEATADMAIPDNELSGVSSSLGVSQEGEIGRVTISVDIKHPYIGDLQVSVTTPKGTNVILHNRSGASAHDLVRTYRDDDTQALARVVGEDAKGEWVLRVVDMAKLDEGTLRRWSLEIELLPPSKTVHAEAAPGLTIPDDDLAGVSSIILVTQQGTVQSIKTSIDITHTYIGDLRIELVAPSGQQALLHNRTGGTQDNLIAIYDPASAPALQSMIGQSIEGNWILRTTDLAGQDIGKLNKWGLELTL